MSALLKKLESKVGKVQQERESSDITDVLDEICSSIESLGKTVNEDTSRDDRISALEKLLMQIYDALEKNRQIATSQESADQQEKLAQSNDLIASLLNRIIADESKQESLVQAIHEGQRMNAEMCGMIENSITNALMVTGERQVVFNEAAQVAQWNFHVVRDERGDMSDVIATARLA